VPVSSEELVSTLVARKRAERLAFAARSEHLREKARSELEMARLGGLIERAWLIGSLAWGQPGSGSDVDIVVAGLGADQVDALWARLSRALGDQLDLLRLEELPPSFRARVLAEGVLLS
jgi:predicted nucleotidyltransferase